MQKSKVQIFCNGLITGLWSHLLSFAELHNRFTELDKFIQTCGNEPHSMCKGTGKTHKLYLNTSLMGQTVNLNTELIYILKQWEPVVRKGSAHSGGVLPVCKQCNKTISLPIRSESPALRKQRWAAFQWPLKTHNFVTEPERGAEWRKLSKHTSQAQPLNLSCWEQEALFLCRGLGRIQHRVFRVRNTNKV